jgi:hypothetical protein
MVGRNLTLGLAHRCGASLLDSRGISLVPWVDTYQVPSLTCGNPLEILRLSNCQLLVRAALSPSAGTFRHLVCFGSNAHQSCFPIPYSLSSLHLPRRVQPNLHFSRFKQHAPRNGHLVRRLLLLLHNRPRQRRRMRPQQAIQVSPPSPLSLTPYSPHTILSLLDSAEDSNDVSPAEGS